MALFDFFNSPEFQNFSGALQKLGDRDTAYRNDQHMQKVFAANPAFGQALYNAKNQMVDNELRRQDSLIRLQKLAQGGDLPAALQIANALKKAQDAGDTQTINNILMSGKLVDKGLVADSSGVMQPVQGYGPALGSIAADKAGMAQQATKNVDLSMNPLIETGVSNARNASQLAYTAPTEAAKIAGQAQGNIERRAVNAGNMLDLLGEARILLPKATSGGIETAGKSLKTLTGTSDEKTQADARLETISAGLVGNVPRMEGPQSDKDVAMYREAAGDIANTKKPYKDRLAAVDTIERLQKKYAGIQDGGAMSELPSAAEHNGRTITELDANGNPVRKLKSDGVRWNPI